MSRVDRVKRRLLREVVEENVRLVRGEAPPRRRRPFEHGAVAVLATVAVALPLLMASSFSAGLEGPPDAKASAPTPRAVASAPVAAPPHRPRRFEVPRPLDPRSLPLGVHRIVIDPGHGGKAVGTHTPGGLLEKDLNLDLALRLRRLLQQAAFEVRMTRDRDEAVSLEERARFANTSDADIFVSIHVNWIANRQVRGVETYYLGPTDDPFVTQLAATENRGSGLSLADLRPLLDEIYLDVRSDESRHLAQAVQQALYRSLRQANPDLDDRGVKTAPFIVLAETEMPAILAEVSCLSNRREANLLARPLYRQHIAEALFSGIRAYAEALDEEGPDL